MFVRVKTTPNSPRQSVQLVESIRQGEKVSQRIVRHVGIAMDNDELVHLKRLALHIKAKIEENRNPKLFPPEVVEKLLIDQPRKKKKQRILVNLKEIVEEQRLIQGIHDVYGKLYEELGFNEVFPNPARKKMATRILRQMVLARIANPKSKRGSVNFLERDFGVRLNLDYVYKVMDRLDEKAIENIKEKAYKNTQSLFAKGKVDVVFFDATTLYFESFTEDELKQNGYSKDGKFNQPQVLLALLTTKEGLPVGYEVFPGKVYEGHTLIPMLEKIRKRYNLDKVIFVADSGLFNLDNLNALEKHGFEYVVGARIKNLNQKLTDKVLDRKNYRPIELFMKRGVNKVNKESEEGEESGVLIASFWYQKNKGRRLITTHSQKRARKDAHDRQKAIDKLLAKKDLKKLVSNYGYKKYIKVSGKTKVTIDQEKIKLAQKWDGLHGVITNTQNFSEPVILAHYHSLWQIEESFRVTKHDLCVRPIFHWKPRRVRAHIAISFTSYTLVRHMEHRIRLQYQKLSPKVIKNELLHVQASILKDQKTGKRYVLPSNMSTHARKIYKVMGLERSITPYEIK